MVFITFTCIVACRNWISTKAACLGCFSSIVSQAEIQKAQKRGLPFFTFSTLLLPPLNINKIQIQIQIQKGEIALLYLLNMAAVTLFRKLKKTKACIVPMFVFQVAGSEKCVMCCCKFGESSSSPSLLNL